MLYAKGDIQELFLLLVVFTEFSEAVFKLSAHFYKAEAHLLAKIFTDYLAVLEFKQNQFTERALSQAARIEIAKTISELLLYITHSC